MQREEHHLATTALRSSLLLPVEQKGHGSIAEQATLPALVLE
jgi:hypothetical protein